MRSIYLRTAVLPFISIDENGEYSYIKKGRKMTVTKKHEAEEGHKPLIVNLGMGLFRKVKAYCLARDITQKTLVEMALASFMDAHPISSGEADTDNYDEEDDE